MQQDSLLTDDILSRVDTPLTEPFIYSVQKRDIRRFVEAVEDLNPLWQDEEFAQKTRHGGVIASPIFVNSLRPAGYMENLLSIGGGRFRVPIALGTEFNFFGVIYVNDTITVTTKLAEAREQETRRGKMLILIGEKIYTNQHGELVAIERSSVGKYPKTQEG